MEAQLTLMPKSYWSSTGTYQEQFDKLYEEMVPSSGSAKTFNGELIRAISRLFYEYCNNGNCNACETRYEEEEVICTSCSGSGVICCDDGGEEIECEDCSGYGYIEEEVEADSSVSIMYSHFLQLISSVGDISLKRVVDSVSDIIVSNSYGSRENFSDERMNVYNELCDRVIFYVLNNKDKEIPSFYKN